MQRKSPSLLRGKYELKFYQSYFSLCGGRLEAAGKPGFYLLDRKFGFLPKTHYNMGVILRIAQMVHVTPFRNVSHIVKILTQTDILHQTALRLSRIAAGMVREYKEADIFRELANKKVPERGLLG